MQVAEKHVSFSLLKNVQMQGTRNGDHPKGGESALADNPKSEAYIEVRRNDEE